jgi:hypothetical protein
MTLTRTTTLSTRVDDEIYRAVVAAATALHLRPSEYLRGCIMAGLAMDGVAIPHASPTVGEPSGASQPWPDALTDNLPTAEVA